MPSAYSATTKNHLVLGAGVIEIAGVKYVTRGGVRFTPGIETRQVEFDGRAPAIAGLDYIVAFAAVLECTLLEASAAVLAAIMPGATSQVVGDVTTITPPDAYALIPAASLPQVRGLFKRSDGAMLYTVFPKAWITQTALESADRTEAGMPITVGARLDMDAGGATTDDAPFYQQIDLTP